MTTAIAEEKDTEDVKNPMMEQQIYLLPEELDTDPEFDVRPWSTEHGQGQEDVDSLAEQIKKLGQLDDLIVFPNDKGRHTVVAGHRRRLAVEKLNTERGKGGDRIRLRCRVETDPEAIALAFEKAISSNQDRLNMGPLNIARLIQRLRKVHGTEAKGTAIIKNILRLKSKASVTQHERLLTDECSDAIRKQLQDGTISLESAFDFMKAGVTEPEKVADVVAEAKKAQVKAETKKIDKKAAAGKAGPAKAEKLKAAVKAKTRVEAPALRTALREVAPDAKIKRSMRDVKSFFKEMAGDYSLSSATGQPKYGYPDGVVQIFLMFFAGPDKVEAWLDGEGAVSTLQKKWDALVDAVGKSDMGTKTALAAMREKEEQEAEKKKKEQAKVRAAKAAEKKEAEEKAVKADGGGGKKDEKKGDGKAPAKKASVKAAAGSAKSKKKK